MSYGEQTRNPHVDTEQAEDHPLYCRACQGYLGEYEAQTPASVTWWNGWPWCPEHAEEMQRLAQSPDPVNEVRR